MNVSMQIHFTNILLVVVKVVVLPSREITTAFLEIYNVNIKSPCVLKTDLGF